MQPETRLINQDTGEIHALPKRDKGTWQIQRKADVGVWYITASESRPETPPSSQLLLGAIRAFALADLLVKQRPDHDGLARELREAAAETVRTITNASDSSSDSST